MLYKEIYKKRMASLFFCVAFVGNRKNTIEPTAQKNVTATTAGVTLRTGGESRVYVHLMLSAIYRNVTSGG